MIQAKFRCSQIIETDYFYQVKLSPVYSSDKNYPDYSGPKATPSDSIELTVTNKNVRFEVGSEYFVNFEKVVAPIEKVV